MSQTINRLAFFGGTPLGGVTWPQWPCLGSIHDVLDELVAVLRSDRWTVRAAGQSAAVTEQFEYDWAVFCQTQYALAVNSGSVALELALRGLQIGPGDEVIVPALGWYATAAAVCRVGAVPVFADIDPATSCIDAQAAARRISPRTRAIIAVHLHCALADLAALAEVAERHGLFLIEDASQAHGGMYCGRPVGSLGRVGCFSFNQEKTIASGEGGAIVTDDPDLYERLYALRTDGYRPRQPGDLTWRPHGAVQGGNACLSELQAVVLRSQLEAFPSQDERRRTHAEAIDSALQRSGLASSLKSAAGTTRRPYYEFAFTCTPHACGNWPTELISRCMTAELGAEVHCTDEPVPTSRLLGPGFRAASPPAATKCQRDLLVFHHRLLLLPDIVRVLPAALAKVLEVAEKVPAPCEIS